MGILKFAGRLVVVLLVLTIIGQLRWRGETLESYYHRGVNSDRFQTAWSTASEPFRWFGERVGLSPDRGTYVR